MTIPIVGSWLDAVRRNHALEHATATVLMSRLGPRRMAGRAAGNGFFLFGDVTREEIEDGAREALARLQAGESTLAVSPYCGTNIAVAGLLAAGAASLSLSRGRDGFGNAFLGAMAGIVLSQPLGRLLQRHVTTRADLEHVELAGADTYFGALHRIRTRAS
ncbi:MAG: DUF6391 domain-containing protein [Dehalococcoidia bacterium]